jgi:hypothetical protein
VRSAAGVASAHPQIFASSTSKNIDVSVYFQLIFSSR